MRNSEEQRPELGNSFTRVTNAAAALTFVLLLLLRDFPQLLAELTDDLLLFQLLAGQNCVEVCLETAG